MSRYLTDDFINKDPRALLNTAKMATLSNVITPTSQYIKATGENELTLEADCVFCIAGMSVFKSVSTIINAGNLDTGSAFTAGKDYYVYVCDIGSGNDERYVMSLNSTFPTGHTAFNTRKIGGFHFGKCRRTNTGLVPVNASNAAKGAGWESNVYDGIIPRSVWTLAHRPKCAPEGMVYMGDGTWVDIYLSSDDGAGGLLSKHNATPMTGTEGLDWYKFVERMLVTGKRLLSYDEFCRAAFGSPQGLAGDNTNAWTGGSARQLTGYVANAVSSIGCRDCVGNVWEWLKDLITNASGRVLMGTTNPTSYTYTDRYEADGTTRPIVTNGTAHGTTTRGDTAAPVVGAWGWDRVSPFPGNGNIYEYYDQSLIALIAGGGWDGGVNAGARAVYLNSSPWIVGTGIGARGACDSL